MKTESEQVGTVAPRGPSENMGSTDPVAPSAQEAPAASAPTATEPTENEKSIARQNDLTRAAKLLVVDVRDSADWAHHYLAGGNHDAFRAAYARLHEKLKEAHTLLTQHIDNLETV